MTGRRHGAARWVLFAPTSPCGSGRDNGDDEYSGVKEHDRFLPITNINCIMKKAILVEDLHGRRRRQLNLMVIMVS